MFRHRELTEQIRDLRCTNSHLEKENLDLLTEADRLRQQIARLGSLEEMRSCNKELKRKTKELTDHLTRQETELETLQSAYLVLQQDLQESKEFYESKITDMSAKLANKSKHCLLSFPFYKSL